MDEDLSAQLLASTRFWIQRVFVPIMVCIGVGGNAITVIVLTRKKMRCSTNIYLTALAVADIIYLLLVFFLSFSVYNNIHDRKYELYWRFKGLTHWLCDSASNASVWLTVSFTLERYIAVCHPIKGKVLCTENRAKLIITGIAIFCILTALSTTFEYGLSIQEQCLRNCTEQELESRRHSSSSKCPHNITIKKITNSNLIVCNGEEISDEKSVKDCLSSLNISSSQNCTTYILYISRNSNKSKPVTKLVTTNQSNPIEEVDRCCEKNFTVTTEMTNLGNDERYSTFMAWFSSLCFGLIPVILIATFNCFLVHAVYKSQSRRRRMTNSKETVSMSNENRITVMLIGVVFLFLTCQTPTASFLIYNNFYKAKNERTDNINKAIGNIFNLLVTVNAATNFIMYCILSKKYRTTFSNLFCGFGGRRKNRQDTLMLSSTRTHYTSVYNNGLRRNASEYSTPRNLETQSLTSIPRSKSLMTRAPGKAKSSDLNI